MNILSLRSTDIQDYNGILKFIRALDPAAGPVIGVPAMGKTAEQLVKAAQKAAAQDLAVASALLEGLRTYHMQVAQQVISEPRWKDSRGQLRSLFEELTTLINGLFLLGELSPHGRRLVASYGERAAALILADALADRKIPTRVLSSRESFLTESAPPSLREEIRESVTEGRLPILPLMLAEKLASSV